MSKKMLTAWRRPASTVDRAAEHRLAQVRDQAVRRIEGQEPAEAGLAEIPVCR